VKPVNYITSFRKLILTEPISGSIELMPGINITNDPTIKAQWLTPQCRDAIGQIEAAHLERESNFVFGEFDTEDMHEMPPEASSSRSSDGSTFFSRMPGCSRIT